MNTDPISPDLHLKSCLNCRQEMPSVRKFCPFCGQDLSFSTTRQMDVNKELSAYLAPVLMYFFVTVLLLGLYGLTELVEHTSENFIGLIVIDSIVTLVFGMYYFRDMLKLYNGEDFNPLVAVGVLGVVIPLAFLVHWLADRLNILLGVENYSLITEFQDTQNPFFYGVLFICMQPAIFEEMAFRGFIFNLIERLSSATIALIVSTILFGIVHFSPISLLWLLPLGYIFGYLRLKYGVLWYGMIGHFAYNFTLILLEYTGSSL